MAKNNERELHQGVQAVVPASTRRMATKAARENNGEVYRSAAEQVSRRFSVALSTFLLWLVFMLTWALTSNVAILAGVAFLVLTPFIHDRLAFRGSMTVPHVYAAEFMGALEEVWRLAKVDRDAAEVALANLRILAKAANEADVVDPQGRAFDKLEDDLRGVQVYVEKWTGSETERLEKVRQLNAAMRKNPTYRVMTAVREVSALARKRQVAISAEAEYVNAPQRELEATLEAERAADADREAELARDAATREVSNLLDHAQASISTLLEETDGRTQAVDHLRRTLV